jgi:hypothetical protein
MAFSPDQDSHTPVTQCAGEALPAAISVKASKTDADIFAEGSLSWHIDASRISFSARVAEQSAR